jgi:hypothetical protein
MDNKLTQARNRGKEGQNFFSQSWYNPWKVFREALETQVSKMRDIENYTVWNLYNSHE